MYKCPNCDYSSDSAINYCPQCGAKTVVVEPVVAAPTEQITYSKPTITQQNQYYPAPVPAKKPNLAKKIVGMVLSIEAFVASILGFIYTLTFSAVEGGVGFVMAIIFVIFDLPPAIIGLVMSRNNIKDGDTSTLSRLGKIFGIISIILTGVSLFIGIIALSANNGYSYGYNYYY